MDALEFKAWKKIRIFKQGGVELYADDMEFIHNNEMLYISKGEDFDQGSNFAMYERQKVIGQGGYGTVYQGLNKMTNKQVAIKMVSEKKMSKLFLNNLKNDQFSLFWNKNCIYLIKFGLKIDYLLN